MPDVATERPLPSVEEPDTGPFWAATKDHRLVYKTCNSCQGMVFYPRRHCPHCGSTDHQEHDSAGLGTIYTFTVVRQAGHPFFRARLPYVVAFIDLDEGFRFMAEVPTSDPASVEVGQRVQVEWEDHDAVSVPLFRVVSG